MNSSKVLSVVLGVFFLTVFAVVFYEGGWWAIAAGYMLAIHCHRRGVERNLKKEKEEGKNPFFKIWPF